MFPSDEDQDKHKTPFLPSSFPPLHKNKRKQGPLDKDPTGSINIINNTKLPRYNYLLPSPPLSSFKTFIIYSYLFKIHCYNLRLPKSKQHSTSAHSFLFGFEGILGLSLWVILREWQVQQLLGWWEEMGALCPRALGFKSRTGGRRTIKIIWGEIESGFFVLLPIHLLLLLLLTLIRLLRSNLVLLSPRSRKLLDSLLCRYNIFFSFFFLNFLVGFHSWIVYYYVLGWFLKGILVIDCFVLCFSIIQMYAEEAIVVYSLVWSMKPMMYAVISSSFIFNFLLNYIFVFLCAFLFFSFLGGVHVGLGKGWILFSKHRK